uniref:FHL1/2/3/5 N-terminal LIM domain-containing protein n=1 Tax=Acanthochromis polyacanthus TaxID=80966 RepID=A0A3Q1ET44_9TELE
MSDHFDCKNCNESLYGRKYIQVEAEPHCIPCYDRLHANTCQECKEVIGHNAKVPTGQHVQYSWLTTVNAL